MTARADELLREGDLTGALKNLQDAVRKDPSNARSRTFLFQLLAVRGEWERSLTQLNVVNDLDKESWPMVQTYREAIRCEALRGEVFAGRQTPLIFGQPQEWLALLLQSLQMFAGGHYARAEELRGLAFEQAVAAPGSVNGEPFLWIADADERLGPVFEAFIDGKYYWVPFQQIRAIRIAPPEDLRDLVWLPAQLRWSNGGESYALVPSRYPGSEKSGDDALALARKTEWRELAEGIFEGLGQRLLTTDGGEYSLFEIRDVAFETEPAQAAAE
jgi:type VI secretion system protein ImpE